MKLEIGKIYIFNKINADGSKFYLSSFSVHDQPVWKAIQRDWSTLKTICEIKDKDIILILNHFFENNQLFENYEILCDDSIGYITGYTVQEANFTEI